MNLNKNKISFYILDLSLNSVIYVQFKITQILSVKSTIIDITRTLIHINLIFSLILKVKKWVTTLTQLYWARINKSSKELQKLSLQLIFETLHNDDTYIFYK